jgi:hypothetical protein
MLLLSLRSPLPRAVGRKALDGRSRLGSHVTNVARSAGAVNVATPYALCSAVPSRASLPTGARS